MPWEENEDYPSNFAAPAEIAVEASNGASDYGNKFGEPVLAGFARSFGLRLSGGERREYIKPIMFSGGIGNLDDRHIKKLAPQTGIFLICIFIQISHPVNDTFDTIIFLQNSPHN